MNVFVGEYLHVNPDIWGTVVGMTLMLVALVFIPFVDRSPRGPRGWRGAFNLRERGFAFGAMVVFWLAMAVGAVTNFFAGKG